MHKITSKDLIIDTLFHSGGWMAVHELGITSYSQNNLATRLPELAREGKVIGRFREKTNYKEWKALVGKL